MKFFENKKITDKDFYENDNLVFINKGLMVRLERKSDIFLILGNNEPS